MRHLLFLLIVVALAVAVVVIVLTQQKQPQPFVNDGSMQLPNALAPTKLQATSVVCTPARAPYLDYLQKLYQAVPTDAWKQLSDGDLQGFVRSLVFIYKTTPRVDEAGYDSYWSIKKRF